MDEEFALLFEKEKPDFRLEIFTVLACKPPPSFPTRFSVTDKETRASSFKDFLQQIPPPISVAEFSEIFSWSMRDILAFLA
ncbi:Uncharacterised protein [Chlamydia trachomatis]|nr:Uncharacterised protein [Chlamydia trachomatis]